MDAGNSGKTKEGKDRSSHHGQIMWAERKRSGKRSGASRKSGGVEAERGAG